MVSWKQVVTDEPDFADRVRSAFGVRKHATMATIRRDGSPRISGTEIEFDDESGEIYLGMMSGALRADDLRRDPRLGLHSPTQDPPEDDPSAWPGEAKISGTAVEVSDPAADSHRFRINVTDVVHTRVGTPADHLDITSWHADRGLVHRRR